jgi:BlaI family penicillinase repressor
VNQRISGREHEMMRLFWRERRPLTFTDLRELERTNGWKKSTVQTYMVRLRDKGVIAAVDGFERKGDVTRYIPTVAEEAFLLDESASMLDKLFEGSALKMVAALRRGGRLSDADIAELREFFLAGGDGE